MYTQVVGFVLHLFLFEMRFHTIDQAGLEFVNLLPQPRLKDVGLDLGFL